MKRLAILVLFLFCAGCGITAMSNEEIVKQKKICDEAGMDTDVVQNGITYAVIHVQCIPRKPK